MKLIKSRNLSFQDIQDEMNRVLEDAFGDMGLSSRTEGREIIWRPAVELSEKDGSYQLKAELPGMNKDDLEVDVGEDSITIKGETKQKEEEKEENVYKSEIRYGKFLRTIPLPTAVDNSAAKAEFKDGVLIISVPKSKEEQQKVKRVNIG